MATVYAVSVGCVLVASLWLWLWLRSSKNNAKLLPLPPGRLGLPLLGETLIFFGDDWGSVKFIRDRMSQFGDVFKTHLLGFPTICIATSPGLRFLSTNEAKLVKTWWPGNMLSVLGYRSLLALEGEEAKAIRQALMVFFKPQAVKRYTAVVDWRTRAFLKEHWEGKQEVTVRPLMARFAFSVACDLLVGRAEDEEQRLLEKLFRTMEAGMFSLPIKLPWTKYTKSLSAASVLRRHLQTWIDERRRELMEGKAAANQDIMSCLLTYKDEDGRILTDSDIKDNLLLLLFAGHETSTSTMTNVCRFLAQNPAILNEVWKENQEIAARKGSDAALTWEDLQCMKYSWKVVQETMRIQPSARGAFKSAVQEFDYNGYRIPKGWKFYWSISCIHSDPKNFVDPWKFDPLRFDGNGPAPYTFVPFGSGPRMCLGNEYARMQILILLHHLVLQFTWSRADRFEDTHEVPSPQPTNGLPIRLQARAL